MDSSRPAPHACGACPTLVGFQGFLTFQWNSLFGSSPFTAPNSRSPPKFDHSLSFTLLPKRTRATLHHGCPCPGSNHDAASASTRRRPPPPTTHYPPLTTHSLFTSRRHVRVFASFPTTDFHTFRHANSLVCIDLPPLCPLFALFSAFVSFVFNRLQPLFRKHPGWGYLLSLHRFPEPSFYDRLHLP